MNLSNLHPPAGQKQKRQRIGQGMGTRRGKFSGRGAKGAKSISGYSKMRGFEGGQMPLHRRMPKRGFTNPFREEYVVLNLSRLDKLEGSEFTPEILQAAGVLKKLEKGWRLIANTREHAGQEVAHLHLHVLGGKRLGRMLPAAESG